MTSTSPVIYNVLQNCYLENSFCPITFQGANLAEDFSAFINVPDVGRVPLEETSWESDGWAYAAIDDATHATIMNQLFVSFDPITKDFIPKPYSFEYVDNVAETTTSFVLSFPEPKPLISSIWKEYCDESHQCPVIEGYAFFQNMQIKGVVYAASIAEIEANPDAYTPAFSTSIVQDVVYDVTAANAVDFGHIQLSAETNALIASSCVVTLDFRAVNSKGECVESYHPMVEMGNPDACVTNN